MCGLRWVAKRIMDLRMLVALVLSTLALGAPSVAQTKPLRVVILGDSLTAGYRLATEQAYPALLQQRAEAEGIAVQFVNAGVSGDTTAGGLRRIDWLLRAPVDVVVVALGANDGLRGLDLSLTEQNLRAIIAKVRDRNPQVQVVLAGMQLPPNLGEAYTSEFRALFPRLADELDARLIPFLLDGVAGQPELNLRDGMHPNEAGHQVIAATVWKYLRPLLTQPVDSVTKGQGIR